MVGAIHGIQAIMDIIINLGIIIIGIIMVITPLGRTHIIQTTEIHIGMDMEIAIITVTPTIIIIGGIMETIPIHRTQTMAQDIVIATIQITTAEDQTHR